MANDQGPDLTGEGMWAPSTYVPPVRLGDGRSYLATSAPGTSTGQWTDANGNINGDGVGTLDTLGRTLVTQQAGQNQITYQVHDSNGVLQTYTLNTSTVTVDTSFRVTGTHCQQCNVTEVSGPATVASSLVLPNNQSYQFQYENGTYGGLTQITLPTGATISYTWATFQDSVRTYRYIASRTVNVGGHNYTWNFVRSGTDQNLTVDETDPLGNHTVYGVNEGAITSASFYQGAASGNPLRQYVIDYTWDLDPWLSSERGGDYVVQQVGKRPIRITTTLDNGQVSKKEFDYETFSYTFHPCLGDGVGTPCSQPHGNTFTTSRGNVSEVREYDWGAVPSSYGSGTPGPLLRRIDKTYLHNSNSNYLSYNIVDKVLQDTTYDGSGNQVAQTQYEYDNYVSGQNALISTSSNQAPQHDYTNYSSTFTYRGNATRVKKWRNTDGVLLTTTYTYDDLGNIRAVQDPLGNTSSYSYVDRWSDTTQCQPVGGNGQAYVTLFTNPKSQNDQLTYFPCTGLTQAQQDQNDLNASRAGTTYLYDLFGRQTQKKTPDGGETDTAYNDVPPVSVTATTKINSSQNLVSTAVKDGLARTTQTQLTSDPQGTVYADTAYDALGRVSTVSNPYRSGSDPTTSSGTTTYFYDAIGRKCLEVPPDGTPPSGGACPTTQPANTIFTMYSGNTTTVTDQTGKSRKSVTDSLGRLIQVFEDPVGVNYETDYGYDALNDLLCAAQKGTNSGTFTNCTSIPAGWHPRTFSYDSLSRLLTSTNPETGTITYKYDSDTNCPTPNSFPTLLVSKMDARGIRTCSQFDALNREVNRNYSNGDASIVTVYDQANCLSLPHCDNIGHATSITDAAGSEAWSFDIVDRMHREQRTTISTPNNITKTSTYSFDLAGNLTSVTYPTGRVVNYTYDSANRPSNAKDASNGINYAMDWETPPSSTNCTASAICYTPQGTFYALSIGQTSTFTGLNLSHSYNNRLQPNEFKASSSGGNAIDITYSFVDSVTGKNAGHVNSITNNLDGTRSQTFNYDQLNRLTAAQTTSTWSTSPAHCWGEAYTLDAWGNLNSIAATSNSAYTGCSLESGFTATADGNNHLPVWGYDASGNATSDGTYSYTYDAESQIKTANGVTYAYDGDGRRVSKSNGKLYWYGSGGEILAETDASGNPTAEYIFFGGKRIAMLPAGGSPIYYVEDLLGTSRVITTNTGTVCYDADFYPYGGERAYTNTCPQNYKFEGKERDTETGNDDFGARYYSNRFGRWLSADWSATPVPVPYANLTNPQTLNLYAMVADDPESFADLDGHVMAGSAGQDEICTDASGCNHKTQQNETAQNGNQVWNRNPVTGEPLCICQNQAQQRHPKKKKAKTPKRPLVKAEPGGTYHSKAASNRDVSYYAVTLDSNGKPVVSPNHVLTLSEHWKGEPGAAYICDPPCVQHDPYYIQKGEMVDGQSVLAGQNYSVERRWSVDGIAAGILDENSVAWDFEILHVSNDNAPYFTIVYGNDPKPPN
jgi:RHS repeat-associated protein